MTGVQTCALPILELPPSWFTPAAPRRRTQDATLPGVELYYSILPPEGAAHACPPTEAGRGALGAMQRLGSVGLVLGAGGPPGERLKLGEALEVEGPAGPLRPAQTAHFTIHLRTDSTLEHFTLRWVPHSAHTHTQIGRASCRERVSSPV